MITLTILVSVFAFLAAGVAAVIRGLSNISIPPIDDDEL